MAVKQADLGLHWHLKLFGPGGKEVPRKLLDEGIRRDLMVGGEYRVTGRAPPQIMKRDKKISGLEIAGKSSAAPRCLRLWRYGRRCAEKQ